MLKILFSFILVVHARSEFDQINRFIIEALKTPDLVLIHKEGRHACRLYLDEEKKELIARGKTPAEARSNVQKRCLIFLCQHSNCEVTETRFENYETCTEESEISCLRF